MSQSIFISPFNTVFFQNSVAVGAKMFFYETETLVPIDIFDADGAPLDNPISANLYGQFPSIYIGDDVGEYRVQLQTSTGSVIDDVDPMDNLVGEIRSSGGSAKVGYIQGGFGSVARTVQDRLRERVSLRDFGAVCDGVTDDTIAVQKAVDYANGFADACSIYVPGETLITNVVVNRRVDTKTGYLRFIGTGPGAGFTINSPGTMFTSTLTGTPTGAPQSEKISFEDIEFRALDATQACFIISKNFLRIWFRNCIYYKIKPCYIQLGSDTVAFAQQINFSGGHATQFQGYFFDAYQMYACSVEGLTLEAGGTGSGGIKSEGGVFGLSVTNCVGESLDASFLYVASSLGLNISGNYTESNGGPDYIFANVGAGGSTRSVNFSGNFMYPNNHISDPTFWNVIVGNSAVASSGNYCSHQMFDDTATAYGNLTSIGDHSETALNKTGLDISPLPDEVETMALFQSFAGTNAATATPITHHFTEFSAGTGGAILPSCDFSTFGKSFVVSNLSLNPATIYAKGSDTINVSPSIVIPSSGRITFYGMQGKWTTIGDTPLAAIPDCNAGTVVTTVNTLLSYLRLYGYMLT